MNKTLRFRKIRPAIVLTVAFVLVSASAAYARNIASYDLIVPRIGGKAYTSTLTKVNTSSAVDSNTGISNNYKQYIAVWRTINGSLTKVTNEGVLQSSGTRLEMPYNSGQNIPASGYRLGHQSQLTTLVDVEAWGTWSPDAN